MNNDKLNNFIQSYIDNMDQCMNCLGMNPECAFYKGTVASLTCKESILKYLESEDEDTPKTNRLYESISYIEIDNEIRSRKRINFLAYGNLKDKRSIKLTTENLMYDTPYCRFITQWQGGYPRYLEGTTFSMDDISEKNDIFYIEEFVERIDDYSIEELMRRLSKEDYVRYLKDKMDMI